MRTYLRMPPEERVFTWLRGNKFLPLRRNPLPFVEKTRVVDMAFPLNAVRTARSLVLRTALVRGSSVAAILSLALAMRAGADEPNQLLSLGESSVFTLSGGGVATTLVVTTPGTEPCHTNGLPEGYGWFLLQKNAQFSQTSAAAAAEITGANARIEIQPPSAYGVSNAVVSGPGGFKASLASAGAGSLWSNSYSNEAALDAALAAGPWSTTYQLGFTNGESFSGFFPFTLVSNVPPVPQIANFEAGQVINPAASFTLSWTPWIGAGTNEFVGLSIIDGTGAVAFSAATDCSGAISLPAGASSVAIPAGQLRAGTTYSAFLTFASPLYRTLDDASLFLERALQSRTTRAALKTTGSSGGTAPTLSGTKIVGTNLVFSIEGSPGGTFTVQSTTDFATWANEVSGTLSAAGRAEVTLPLATTGAPKFYRVQATGGGSVDPDPAELGLALTGANQLTLTVKGNAGARYLVQSTADYVTWTDLQEVSIVSGATSVQVVLPIPAGTSFLAYRAKGVSAPTPTGKQPTLAIGVVGSSLRLAVTGGDASRNYVFQTASADLSSWTATTSSVTTDASGNGAVTITPTSPSALYRAVAQ